MAAPIMGDDAVALFDKIEQLRIPIVATQRPPVVKDNRLGALRAPVLVVDFSAVFSGDRTHYISSLFLHDLCGHHGVRLCFQAATGVFEHSSALSRATAYRRAPAKGIGVVTPIYLFGYSVKM